MKVFCILKGMDYDGYDLVKIFTTKEQAENWIRSKHREIREIGGEFRVFYEGRITETFYDIKEMTIEE